MPFHVTEPHPSVPKNKATYIHTGRGGAGNYARYKSTDLTVGSTATGPASRSKLPSPPTQVKFTSGRGGAGNTFTNRSESPRRIFSFDEELARDQRLMDNAAKAPVYHIGRGGQGNAVDQEGAPRRRSSLWSVDDSLSRTTSNESGASSNHSTGSRRNAALGALSRLGRTLSRA